MTVKVDKLDLEKDLEDFSSEVPLSVISETFFLLPTQFNVNGKEIFEFKNKVSNETFLTLNLPVFSLLFDWMEKLEKLPFEKRVKILLAEAGQLNIVYEDGMVTITTNFNNVVAVENYEVLLMRSSDLTNLLNSLKKEIPTVFLHKEIAQMVSSMYR
jgi:hypothetical protein